MSASVLYSTLDHGIAILTLNRPEAANALSLNLLHELRAIQQELKFNRNVRCVIVTGAGEKVFCAGADLKERAQMNETQVRQTVSLIREVINEFEQLPQPVICAINGGAFGGGLELALACDIRMAADTAKMGLTETSLAIIPGAGGTQRLPRLIGKGRAKELIYTAKRISAFEAEKIGLVEYVVPSEQLLNQAIQMANQIVENAPIAVAQAKMAINRGLEVDLNTGLKIEQMAYEVTIPTKDRLEGLQAFKEKRKPVYKGE
ncbi:enoyl-CoA hydratase [Thermolongibacillus altinsuensis]|jgi:methylglutaconyl-CoA hydratase|uniref:enoyl-CoA hydratase n=1 Tax=Thermolongibacillus altinsuensis TaxID=575256 RepID=UPI00242A32EA|nr:enoyl-CoA hydratase [Thermolongibacillus altinsuensis]GMB09943.1 putative enoyl-CoA hydratase/isomerase YngF [Thermolongibacillus altinsuensis]